MRLYLAPAFALVTVNASPSDRALEPISVTLCSLSSAPEKYNGLLVRVHARVLSDGMEHTVLVDVTPRCRFGGAGFALAAGVSDPDLKKIEQTIFSGRHPGTKNKFIRGDFVGTFRLTSDTPHMRELEIRSVSNLKITLYGDERP
jgi:hypothetical protein